MSGFSDGYYAYAKNIGIVNAAFLSDRYVNNIQSAIDAFVQDMDALRFNKDGGINNTGVEFMKGRVAEHWHEGTFNINAAVKNNPIYADKVPEMLGGAGLGAPDLQLSNGDSYGLKYYSTAQASAEQQAKSVIERYYEYLSKCRQVNKEPISFEAHVASLKNSDKNAPLYEGQFRLIPSDQFDSARAYLQRRIAEESAKRPELVAKYQDALDMLADRVTSDGIESIPLTEAESKEIARLLKDDGFDPVDFGLTTAELITWDNILKQACQAGLSAAVISVVLEVAPELVNLIIKKMRDDGVDIDDFKRIGFAVFKGGSLGFVRGTVAAALTISCKSGKLGTALQSTNPALIGTIVALTMNAIQNAIIMSAGYMNKQEFAQRCIQDLTVASCAITFGTAFQALFKAAFGSVIQTMLPQLPMLAFMIGSFVGSIVGSVVYKTVYSCAISFCIDTGCTFFGLVSQDYTLPENVLKEIGLEVFEYDKFEPEQMLAETFEAEQFKPEQFTAQTIDITFLRRGVIGVSCIGYV